MFADYFYRNGPMMHAGRDSWVGALFGLFFFLVVVGVVLYVIRLLAERDRRRSPSALREPLDIARERYAKGEISREELAEIKKELA